jgi:hypothetical protein
MAIAKVGNRAITACAAVAILAACSGGASQFQPASTASRQGATHKKSWMNARAAVGELLYLSDFDTGDVYVYSWPALALVGTLTGFANPAGLCTDKAGDIFVTDSFFGEVIEYAHGGTTPIATLNDPAQLPNSCSVNNNNGTLAVGNTSGFSSGPGTVAIYKHATGDPTFYANTNIFVVVTYLGYDLHGNLFVDGVGPATGNFAFASFKNGTFTPITISGATLNVPGNVQFAHGTLTIGSLNAFNTPEIYQITESGTVTGAIPLTGAQNCEQYFIYKHSVVCPDPGTVPKWDVFGYPGSLKKFIEGPFVSPIGSAISI